MKRLRANSRIHGSSRSWQLASGAKTRIISRYHPTEIAFAPSSRRAITRTPRLAQLREIHAVVFDHELTLFSTTSRKIDSVSIFSSRCRDLHRPQDEPRRVSAPSPITPLVPRAFSRLASPATARGPISAPHHAHFRASCRRHVRDRFPAAHARFRAPRPRKMARRKPDPARIFAPRCHEKLAHAKPSPAPRHARFRAPPSRATAPRKARSHVPTRAISRPPSAPQIGRRSAQFFSRRPSSRRRSRRQQAQPPPPPDARDQLASATASATGCSTTRASPRRTGSFAIAAASGGLCA